VNPQSQRRLSALRLGLVVVLLTAVASAANAQPFKCRDAEGRVTYSDTPCPSGAPGGKVDTTNSATIETPERARELRQQQDTTLRRIEQDRLNQSARQQAQNDRLRAASQASAVVTVEQLHASCREQIGRRASDLSARQKANLELVCSGLRESMGTAQLASCLERIDNIKGLSAYQNAQARAGCHGGQIESGGSSGLRPHMITSCDAGGCRDNLGNRYSGTGPTLFRQDGTPCQRVGNELQCRP
jgi:hypothetical protein